MIKRGMDMKDVRLAAFDLDGTLLDSANKISDFTIVFEKKIPLE